MNEDRDQRNEELAIMSLFIYLSGLGSCRVTRITHLCRPVHDDEDRIILFMSRLSIVISSACDSLSMKDGLSMDISLIFWWYNFHPDPIHRDRHGLREWYPWGPAFGQHEKGGERRGYSGMDRASGCNPVTRCLRNDPNCSNLLWLDRRDEDS